MISLTIFKSLYENKTQNRLDLNSWSNFESLLYNLSKVERKNKKSAELISPAIYKSKSSLRRNIEVDSWGGWAAVDVDNHSFDKDLEQELKSLYGQYQYVCYSTGSSKKSLPKFRLVFKLSKNVESKNIKHFWTALNTEMNFMGDKQCKDLSRMYYVPGTYLNAYNFFFTNDGTEIDPDNLMNKHSAFSALSVASNNFIDRLPEELQKEVVNYRKESMENTTKFKWTTYKDCPFVNKKLVDEYQSIAYIDGTGRYSMIYRIMVSIATLAVRNKYPISAQEVVTLIKQLDQATANRYETRPLDIEANRAIEFAYKKM